jgi:hypothetical protein
VVGEIVVIDQPGEHGAVQHDGYAVLRQTKIGHVQVRPRLLSTRINFWLGGS